MVSVYFASDSDSFDEYGVGADLGFDGGVVLGEGCCIRDECVEDRFCGPDVLTVLLELAFGSRKDIWRMLADYFGCKTRTGREVSCVDRFCPCADNGAKSCMVQVLYKVASGGHGVGTI